MGYLEGLFIADTSDIKQLLNKEIYFGEILGKHSEISIRLEEKYLKVKSDDQKFIRKLFEYIGHKTISGHNPIAYWLDYTEGYDWQDKAEYFIVLDMPLSAVKVYE